MVQKEVFLTGTCWPNDLHFWTIKVNSKNDLKNHKEISFNLTMCVSSVFIYCVILEYLNWLFCF